MENMVKAIVFDMDGTLLNTLEDIADAVNDILRKYGMREQSVEEVRMAVGNGARQLMRCVIPGGEEHPQFEEILKNYEEHYQANCNRKTGPYPGICELLEGLKQRQIKMAIVSNKGDGAVKELKDQYFPSFISAAQGVCAGIRRKPSPDSVLEALRILGSSPEEALYVGDSEVDYQTAKNAGMRCVLVGWGFRGRAYLEKLQPDYLIDRPEQLLDKKILFFGI